MAQVLGPLSTMGVKTCACEIGTQEDGKQVRTCLLIPSMIPEFDEWQKKVISVTCSLDTCSGTLGLNMNGAQATEKKTELAV